MFSKSSFALAAAAVVSLSAFAPVSAVAEGGGGGEWYWRLGAGVSIPDDIRQDISVPPFTSTIGAPTTQVTKADTGYNVGGGIGYTLNKSWRLEGELRYVSAEIGNVRQSNALNPSVTVSGDGDASATLLMFNGILDVNIPGRKTFPYFGGGIGYADVSLDGVAGSGSDGTFALQFFAGFNYKMDKGSWLSFQATYLDTGEVEYDPLGQDPGTFIVGEADFSSIDLTVSFNRKFN